MIRHTHDDGNFALPSRPDLQNHLAAAHVEAFTDGTATWDDMITTHVRAHRLATDTDIVAVTRERLGQVLMAAYGEAPETALDRVWAMLIEPPYQAGRVYVDANDEHWYRDSTASHPWRKCRTGVVTGESWPERPLRLAGPLPTRDEIEKAVQNSYGFGSTTVVTRIMALLEKTGGDPHA